MQPQIAFPVGTTARCCPWWQNWSVEIDHAYAPAYSHGARYWVKLQELAQTTAISSSIETAESFETRIRLQHRRKVSFWAYVNGPRSRETDLVSDD